ncbi:hypothetical protein HY992_00695 [Candidatus Micrarchaeota archaeon]|nr:hypothetical protein [Candidatus Micrarchaeota archaeon]
MNKFFAFSISFALLLFSGCTLVPGVNGSDSNLVGEWRIYSEKFFTTKAEAIPCKLQ